MSHHQERPRKFSCIIGMVLVVSAIGPELAADERGHPRQVVIEGIGGNAPNGIYDPALTEDGSALIWMSYSAVRPSRAFGPILNYIDTRVAYSSNGGRDWTDAGIVNEAQDVRLPPPHNELAAVWEHEVSRILYDPSAPEAERWKVLWHRYLRVYDGKGRDSVPLFEHGWIELKTATRPQGPWSSGRKLFVGAVYNSANDSTIGPPEMRLDKLFPGRDAMGNCLAYTEPGMLAADNGIYVSLKCAAGSQDGQVALLHCGRDFRSCRYLGALLRDSDARRYGERFSGFSATDLIRKGNKSYLIISPTSDPAESYRGCLLFEIESLDRAHLRQLQGGKPLPILTVKGDEGSFNGACGYTPGSGKSGVLYSQFFPVPPYFRIFESGLNLK